MRPNISLAVTVASAAAASASALPKNVLLDAKVSANYSEKTAFKQSESSQNVRTIRRTTSESDNYFGSCFDDRCRDDDEYQTIFGTSCADHRGLLATPGDDCFSYWIRNDGLITVSENNSPYKVDSDYIFRLIQNCPCACNTDCGATHAPSMSPPPSLGHTQVPSAKPSLLRSHVPSATSSSSPSGRPTVDHSSSPSVVHSSSPSGRAILSHSSSPTISEMPTPSPSSTPTKHHSSVPSAHPSALPSATPTSSPTIASSSTPSSLHSSVPSVSLGPTSSPSSKPSSAPSAKPSSWPSLAPTGMPTKSPSLEPSSKPSAKPSASPSGSPSGPPTGLPTSHPTGGPTVSPSSSPTAGPTASPTTTPAFVVQPRIRTGSGYVSPVDENLDGDANADADGTLTIIIGVVASICGALAIAAIGYAGYLKGRHHRPEAALQVRRSMQFLRSFASHDRDEDDKQLVAAPGTPRNSTKGLRVSTSLRSPRYLSSPRAMKITSAALDSSDDDSISDVSGSIRHSSRYDNIVSNLAQSSRKTLGLAKSPRNRALSPLSRRNRALSPPNRGRALSPNTREKDLNVKEQHLSLMERQLADRESDLAKMRKDALKPVSESLSLDETMDSANNESLGELDEYLEYQKWKQNQESGSGKGRHQFDDDDRDEMESVMTDTIRSVVTATKELYDTVANSVADEVQSVQDAMSDIVSPRSSRARQSPRFGFDRPSPRPRPSPRTTQRASDMVNMTISARKSPRRPPLSTPNAKRLTPRGSRIDISSDRSVSSRMSHNSRSSEKMNSLEDKRKRLEKEKIKLLQEQKRTLRQQRERLENA